MAKDKSGVPDRRAEEIKRQLGSRLNKALLQRMPLFKIDANMPRHLSMLLSDLEAREKYPCGSGRRS